MSQPVPTEGDGQEARTEPGMPACADAERAGGGPSGAGRAGGGPSGAGRAGGIMGAVDALDRRVDSWCEPLRGNPTLDMAAKAVTGLGDHGLMWAATTVWRARRAGPGRTQAVRALTVAGVESSLVNAALKSVVGRSRPDPGDLPVAAGGIPVRAPKTSSFPSGHTLAAFCSATVMSQRRDHFGNALLYCSATLVGLSRIHLRAHHASDVLGGMAIGTAIGLVGRRLLRDGSPLAGGRRAGRRR